MILLVRPGIIIEAVAMVVFHCVVEQKCFNYLKVVVLVIVCMKQMKMFGFIAIYRVLMVIFAPNYVAKKFSVESVYHPRPFAVHKPNIEILGSANMKLLCNDCPEVRTISSRC